MLLIDFIISSCETIDMITFAGGNTYFNDDAVIAYDVYDELYKSGVINQKPIKLKMNENGDLY